MIFHIDFNSLLSVVINRKLVIKHLLCKFFNSIGAFVPYECPDTELWERLFPPTAPVDFGWIRTAKPLRVVSEPGQPDIRQAFPNG